MKCKYGYCRTPGSYVVTNPHRDLQGQVEKEQFYCLRHARETFKSDSIVFKDGSIIEVYNVVFMWSNQRPAKEK